MSEVIWRDDKVRSEIKTIESRTMSKVKPLGTGKPLKFIPPRDRKSPAARDDVKNFASPDRPRSKSRAKRFRRDI